MRGLKGVSSRSARAEKKRPAPKGRAAQGETYTLVIDDRTGEYLLRCRSCGGMSSQKSWWQHVCPKNGSQAEEVFDLSE